MRKSLTVALLLASSIAAAGCKETKSADEQKTDTVSAADHLKAGHALYAPQANCDTPTTPFCNSTVPLPAGWQGPVFQLSQNYPSTLVPDQRPWLAIDPKANPEAYIRAVLAYFYEGMITADPATSFDPARNTVRGWYHAPWQDYGPNGREPIHGLTRERVSQKGELAPTQQSLWNNYAVGFYNAAGGLAFGRVWQDHGAPNLSAALMPEGAMAGKLLFTTATDAEVPYLAGSPAWQANIYQDVHLPDSQPKPATPRAVSQVRLLQIDIAVKDKRAGPTGWFFGTFVYGGGPGFPLKGHGWQNVQPVGLMWGNQPAENWINPAVKMPHLGWQGLLNGPVDNPKSSCMSCHSTAQYKQGFMVPATDGDPQWFRDIPSGQPFSPGGTPFDYSLQMSLGIANFQKARQIATAPNADARKALIQAEIDKPSTPPRAGGTTH